MQGLKDEEVMVQYQQGETEAMDELLRRYETPICRFCFRLVGNDTEAQDIAQEVFLRVHQAKESYLPLGKFSTWIFSIAHHLAISRLRKRKWLAIWPRKDVESDELKEFESPDPSPEKLVSDSEIAGIIKRCVQSLPFLQREALILREYENLEYGEIAKILKKSQGTIKTLIHRARENLKHKLLPYVEEFAGGHHA